MARLVTGGSSSARRSRPRRWPARAGSARRRRRKRPNVLFILADDLGYGDLSCYGRPDYQTPVLDAFARQGIKFTSAYAAAPVCTPTRCAYITGRYPQRLAVGLEEPLKDASPPDVGLPPDHPTIASLLEGERLRHVARRQVASGLEAGVRPQPPRLRRVLRHPERRRRLLHAQRPTRRRRGAGASRSLGEPRADRTCRLPDGPVHRTGRWNIIGRRAREAVLPEPAVHGAALAVGRARGRGDRPPITARAR